jgi:hypothetical protein
MPVRIVLQIFNFFIRHKIMALSFDKSTDRFNLSVARKGFDKRSEIILYVVVRNQDSHYMYVFTPCSLQRSAFIIG